MYKYKYSCMYYSYNYKYQYPNFSMYDPNTHINICIHKYK